MSPPNLKKIHTKCLRSLLFVKQSTNYSFLYGELGRQPLSLYRKLYMLRYWSKLRQSEDMLLRNIYTMLRDDANRNVTYNGVNWAHQVKKILDEIGLSNL